MINDNDDDYNPNDNKRIILVIPPKKSLLKL